MSTTYIDVFGVVVSVTCSDVTLTEWLHFDFRQYLAQKVNSNADYQFTTLIGLDQFSQMPPMNEAFRSSRFICYERKQTRLVDYLGKAFIVYDRSEETLLVIGETREITYERLYLAILSRLGERLDSKGMHRIHALAVSYKDRANIFLIPQGGGKSTLGAHLLSKSDGIKLMSDDTPFVDHSGTIYPFLFRMGVGVDEAAMIGAGKDSCRPNSSSHSRKILIDMTQLPDQIEKRSLPCRNIFVGCWTTSPEPHLERASNLVSLKTLFRDCVIGLGTPQVAELTLQLTGKGLFDKCSLACQRLVASLVLTNQTRCFRLYLCRDRQLNAQMVRNFLQSGKS
jgi:hypothetical protein